MSLLQQMAARAKANPQQIVLPEGDEIRTLKAANQILADGLAEIYLIGNPGEILNLAKQNKLSKIADKAKLIDPINHPNKEVYTSLLYELRKNKGMTPEQAARLVEDPLYLACLMIKNGDADGEIAGARNATGDVLRPALQIVKTLPGISVVSGAFLMFVPDKQYGVDGLLIFADCAVMPNPNARELAQIAVSTAGTARSIAGFEPRVAMLSFSTKGSAKHEMVDKVTEAVAIAKEMCPKLEIDGDLQADAALVPAVGKSKAPGSPIAGQANVLVFPSLEAGNIAYKLVQRLAAAEAVGPILQGMAAPVNDLSRGCSVDDIYKMIVITCNQSLGIKAN
ncbi:MAG: phosphate acetyltransferase [Bacteroidales bacterium]|nr:phosphate acetyltransferase [Bacteroidales bacterium]MDD3432090.1 phosphate acetyltransferase [Bacteroidales bacterium]